MIACLVRKRAQLRVKTIAIAVLFACSALTFLACEFMDPKHRGSGPPILQIGEQAARISAGRDHSCILQEDSSPACWGIRGHPHHATVSPDVRLITISSGRGHICGLMGGRHAGLLGSTLLRSNVASQRETVCRHQQWRFPYLRLAGGRRAVLLGTRQSWPGKSSQWGTVDSHRQRDIPYVRVATGWRTRMLGIRQFRTGIAA